MNDIQVGDKVTIDCMGEVETIIITSEQQIKQIKENVAIYTNKILKIERPKYEVVEEKKELLTEEEKEFLRQALKFGNYEKGTTNGTILFIIKKGYYIYLHYDEWGCNTIYIDKNLYFGNLKEDKRYTLKELGLEED